MGSLWLLGGECIRWARGSKEPSEQAEAVPQRQEDGGMRQGGGK